MNNVTFDKENAVCGAFLILCGIIFGYEALQVDLGSWLRIGPGGMPLVLSGLLVLLGVIILIGAMRVEGEPVGKIAWRGMFFILLAPIIFGLTIRGLGFVGAVFLTALFASFTSYRVTWKMALALAVSLSIFATLVFSFGLGLPYERFGPWLRF